MLLKLCDILAKCIKNFGKDCVLQSKAMKCSNSFKDF